MPTKLLFVPETRPEAVKLAPLVLEARARPWEFETRVCVTGQHRRMRFDVRPDHGVPAALASVEG
ncbi:MAG TPA: hypothetical protein VEX86_20725 [Longimicrobium sp.]|nr:hypothetical protein [Longimicrobium sp.]